MITPITVLKIENYGFHFIVKAKLNGHRCRLLIDTGASQSVVDKKFANKYLKHNHYSVNANTTGVNGTSNNAESTFTKIDQLQISDAIIPDVTASVTCLGHVNLAYYALGFKPIHAILGADVMLQSKMTLDLTRRELRG